jgi:hypothetical protein
MTNNDLFAEDANDILKRRIDTAVLEYLRAQRGPAAVVTEPYPKPANLIEGMQVLRVVADRVQMTLIDWARKARAEGTPWRDLVDPLGIDTSEAWIDGPVEAFRLVAGPPSMPHDPIIAHWICVSCGEFITDNGPAAGHPIEAEKGHAGDCARHARDIATWQTRNGE